MFETIANAIGVILLLILLASLTAIVATFAFVIIKDLIQNWNSK